MKQGILPLFFALLLLAACATSQPSDVEAFAQSTPLGNIAPIEVWIDAHPHAAAHDRAIAFDALCDAYMHVGRYRASAEACAREAEIKGHNADIDQSIAFRRVLADLAPISVSGSIDAPLTYGWVGMGELAVTINGVTANWGVDTGAEVSVVSESDARRFGVRMFDHALAIHGSTPGTAGGKLGVIDLMHVGGVDIRNVPVFVLPDAALTLADNHVPPVFGAPIMYAYGRVQFLDHGHRLRLDPGSLAPLPGRMTWNPSGVAIDIALAGGPVHAFFDTGANITELNVSTRALLTRAQRAALVSRNAESAGVSGAVRSQIWEAPSLDIRAAGATCRVPNVRIGDDTGGGSQGRIGVDLAKACKSFTLDFTTMTYAAESD